MMLNMEMDSPLNSFGNMSGDFVGRGRGKICRRQVKVELSFSPKPGNYRPMSGTCTEILAQTE
jgi:hypothetical protein